MDQHTDIVRWTLDTTMQRSLASRAGAIVLPPSFSKDLIAEGAQQSAENCAHCHGTRDGDPAEWSRAMRPTPPHLTEDATVWSPDEIHWIVTNGIRMSGMPAFGQNHSPEAMSLTAFVTAGRAFQPKTMRL